MKDLEWITFNNADEKRKIPKYKRTIGISAEQGVFVPAFLSGVSDGNVFMCAAYDGAKIAYFENRAYFHAEWMLAEFPKSKEAVESAQKAANKFLSMKGAGS